MTHDMGQTPIHDQHNPDLLAALPTDCRMLVEVGCSSGALAREYRRLNPNCRYLGIEIDSGYAELASHHCDEVLVGDIETLLKQPPADFAAADCWVFGDALEHLRDPWRLLAEIRRLSPRATIVACIPNAQHWSVQARLACGQFRYEDAGLLDRTHLRWFTRTTMIELFHGAGYRLVAGRPRIFAEPQRELALALIRQLAAACGSDPDQAVADALPMQYVLTAVPA